VDRWIGSAAFFLMTQQAAFDASRMDLGPETLLEQAGQFRDPDGRLFLAGLDEESQDLVVQLVRLLGAAFVGHQAGEPTLLEGFQRLIERGPGEAESRRGARHRVTLALYAAPHLVLDLDQIPGIEEAVLGKLRIGDGARPRI
jgi:hypothetical protein